MRFSRIKLKAVLAIATLIIAVTWLAGCGGGGGGGATAGPVTAATGTVLSAGNGAPVANFTATTDSGESVTVVGSATGSFTITNVTPGSRTITVAAPEFTTFATSARTVTSGATTDFGTIHLTPASTAPPPPPPGF